MGVSSSVPNGKDRRHEWLEDEPKMQWSIQPAHEVANGLCQILHTLLAAPLPLVGNLYPADLSLAQP